MAEIAEVDDSYHRTGKEEGGNLLRLWPGGRVIYILTGAETAINIQRGRTEVKREIPTFTAAAEC